MFRLWTLRRMKKIGLSNDIIIDVYGKEIRSVLEFGAPVWTGGLTERDAKKNEKIQKTVLKIVLGHEYIDYDSAFDKFKLNSLRDRREKLCIKFSKKEFKKSNSIFNKITLKRNTRNNNKKLVSEFYCNTDRYFRSGLPFLSRLLNKANADKK